jgi:hypothetical protein
VWGYGVGCIAADFSKSARSGAPQFFLFRAQEQTEKWATCLDLTKIGRERSRRISGASGSENPALCFAIGRCTRRSLSITLSIRDVGFNFDGLCVCPGSPAGHRKSKAPPLRLRSGQALSLKARQERDTLGNEMRGRVGPATTEARTGGSRGRDGKSKAPPLRLRSGQALSQKTRQERGTLGNERGVVVGMGSQRPAPSAPLRAGSVAKNATRTGLPWE